jgi:hypothetical protein
MAFDPIRRVTVLFGGDGWDRPGNLNDTWTWDGTTWRIVAVAGTPPVPRSQHAMAFDVHRKVVVMFGGQVDSPDIFADGASDDTYEWDGRSWTYLPRAGNHGMTARRFPIMWYETAAQRVMVFGGTHSFRLSDGTYSHTIYDGTYEGRPPGIWVDFNYPGRPSLVENSYFLTPFNTLAEAVNEASPGCTINLKAGSHAEAITITNLLRLEAFYGPVTIGK